MITMAEMRARLNAEKARKRLSKTFVERMMDVGNLHGIIPAMGPHFGGQYLLAADWRFGVAVKRVKDNPLVVELEIQSAGRLLMNENPWSCYYTVVCDGDFYAPRIRDDLPEIDTLDNLIRLYETPTVESAFNALVSAVYAAGAVPVTDLNGSPCLLDYLNRNEARPSENVPEMVYDPVGDVEMPCEFILLEALGQPFDALFVASEEVADDAEVAKARTNLMVAMTLACQ